MTVRKNKKQKTPASRCPERADYTVMIVKELLKREKNRTGLQSWPRNSSLSAKWIERLEEPPAL